MQTLNNLRQLCHGDPRNHQVLHKVIVENGEKLFTGNELNFLLRKGMMQTLDYDSVGARKFLEYADQLGLK